MSAPKDFSPATDAEMSRFPDGSARALPGRHLHHPFCSEGRERANNPSRFAR